MRRSHVVGLVIAVGLLGAVYVLRHTGVLDAFNPAHIREIIVGAGVWAPLAYMALYVVACMLFIPGSVLTLAGGALFGPLYGTLYTIIGATLGALLAFCVSRFVGRQFVQFGVGSVASKLKEYDEKIAAHGFYTVLFLRFVPLFPFNGLNFALGLTKVTLRDYFFGTLLGIIPGTFAYVYFGDSLASQSLTKILVAVAIVICLAFLGKYLKQNYTKPTTV